MFENTFVYKTNIICFLLSMVCVQIIPIYSNKSSKSAKLSTPEIFMAIFEHENRLKLVLCDALNQEFQRDEKIMCVYCVLCV